eukprot:9704551-Alexandrium_andersonii.AAC.1
MCIRDRSESCPKAARRLPEGCPKAARRLPEECPKDARRMPEGCVAPRSSGDLNRRLCSATLQGLMRMLRTF